MFVPDSQKSWVETQPGEVVYLSTSINRPTIAAPDRSPETTQSYICSIRKAKGYFVYIYLHLISSNTGLLYSWDEGGGTADQVEVLQQNALEFTGSMGFMMDDLRYPELTPEQRDELFAQTPIFHQDISFLKPADESVNELEVLEPAEGESEELVIEAVEDAEELSVAEAAPAEEAEVEEITLDIMTSDEIAPGVADADPSPPPTAPETDEIAQVETVAEPSLNEEDILLDQLEIQEEPQPAGPSLPREAAAESTSIEPDPAESAPAEPTAPEPEMSEPSATAPEPAEDLIAEAAAEEVNIEIALEGDEESSSVLDALEAQAEEAPPIPTTQVLITETVAIETTIEIEAPALSEEPPALALAEEEAIPTEIETPPAVPPPARAVPLPVAVAASASLSSSASPVSDGEVNEDERAFLVRLLAMM